MEAGLFRDQLLEAAVGSLPKDDKNGKIFWNFNIKYDIINTKRVMSRCSKYRQI